MAQRTLSPGEVIEQAPAKPDEYVQNLNVQLICPQCQEMPPNLVEEFSAGDIICGSCGLVLQSRIVDTRSEWRTFSNDDQNGDDPSRIGDVQNPLFESNLATAISYAPDQRSRDLNRAQGKSTNEKTSKALSAAFKQIDDLSASYQLGSNISDLAKHLYKLTDASKNFKGKNQEAIIAGCLFIACRHCEVPRTFREIMNLTKVPKKEIGRIFKLLEKFFQDWSRNNQTQVLGGMAVKSDGYQVTASTKAYEFCGRFCNQLQLPSKVSLIAMDCAKEMVDTGLLAGRSPLSIAGVAIYMITHLMGMPKTTKEIGDSSGVSDGTIRTAYKTIYPQRMNVIKTEYLQKGGNADLLPQA